MIRPTDQIEEVAMLQKDKTGVPMRCMNLCPEALSLGLTLYAPEMTVGDPDPTSVSESPEQVHDTKAGAGTSIPGKKLVIPVHPWQKQITAVFEPGDYLHIFLIHGTETFSGKDGKPHAMTQEYWDTYEGIIESGSLAALQEWERQGWNIYICTAVFDKDKIKSAQAANVARRTNANIATIGGKQVIRAVAIDCDTDGEASVAEIREAITAGKIPPPTIVVQSSTPGPGSFYSPKYQFWWAVSGFTLEQQAAVNTALQQMFGGDEKAKDTVRVLRLAGFVNNQPAKYPHKPVATLMRDPVGGRYSFEDFKLQLDVKPLNTKRPKASSNVIEFKCNQLEENAAEAEFVLGDAQSYLDGGFKYVQEKCPNADEHTTGRGGSCVMVMPLGARAFMCQHSHCAHLNWEWFKNHLNTLAGKELDWTDKSMLIVHGDEKAVPTSSPIEDVKETSLLIFKTAEEVSRATECGFHSLIASDFNPPLDPAYNRVVLCGEGEEIQRVRALVQGRGAINIPWPPYGYPVRPDASEWLHRHMEGTRVADVRKPKTRLIEVPIDSSITITSNEVETEKVETEMISEMPKSALASSRLGDIYINLFEPNDWPLDLALPALVTAASVLVPPLPEEPGVIQGDDNMVNLYTALIAKVGGGKSKVVEWAAKSLNIWDVPLGQHYMEGKWGSAEQLMSELNKNQARLQRSALVNPDELAHLLAKAGIPNASFATILTTSFYRRRQNIAIARNKLLSLNLALSLIGGVVDDEFGTVFNAASIGGLYDRMLFGEARPGFQWAHRDYPLALSDAPLDPPPVAIRSDGSITEVENSWRKKDAGLGRIVEVCIRIAKIYASMDGRAVVTGNDLEALYGLAMRQRAIRELRQPNAGVTPDAIFANAVLGWLRAHTKSGWVNVAALKTGIHCYEMKLGPNVAERCLLAMSRGDQIDLWTPKDGKPLPADYAGPRPRIGLVRLSSRNAR